MSGTTFWPWSSKLILPTIESLSRVLRSSSMTFLRLGPTCSITSMIRPAAVKANGPYASGPWSYFCCAYLPMK